MYRDNVRALTFDLFGTVLDLGGSLVPHIGRFLQGKGSDLDAESFWAQWRLRQRGEQDQDNIMALGHSGYRCEERSPVRKAILCAAGRS